MKRQPCPQDSGLSYHRDQADPDSGEVCSQTQVCQGPGLRSSLPLWTDIHPSGFLGLRSLGFCLRGSVQSRWTGAHARAHTQTHAGIATAFEISLDSGAGRAGARPSNSRAAGQEQTDGNTDAHAGPRGPQVRACVDSSRTGPHPAGITATQPRAAALGGARWELHGEATRAPFADGTAARAAGSGQDTAETRVGWGRGPESWLWKIHRVCVCLSG